MTISWNDWESLRASLDYSWSRMQELRPWAAIADREEYDALAEHVVDTANRLVRLSGADVPDLSTPECRFRWEASSRSAAGLRERIFEHVEAMRSKYDDEAIGQTPDWGDAANEPVR